MAKHDLVLYIDSNGDTNLGVVAGDDNDSTVHPVAFVTTSRPVYGSAYEPSRMHHGITPIRNYSAEAAEAAKAAATKPSR